MERYKEILRDLNITDAEIGCMFGYKNAMSWYNSARRKRVIAGIVELYDRINVKV